MSFSYLLKKVKEMSYISEYWVSDNGQSIQISLSRLKEIDSLTWLSWDIPYWGQRQTNMDKRVEKNTDLGDYVVGLHTNKSRCNRGFEWKDTMISEKHEETFLFDIL